MEVLVKEGLRRRARLNRFDDDDREVMEHNDVNRELKWIFGQTTGSTLAPATSPVIFTDWDICTTAAPAASTRIINIAQGLATNQRIGYVIDALSFDLILNFSTTAAFFDARVWVFWGENEMNAGPGVLDFFHNVSFGGTLNNMLAHVSPMCASAGFELLHDEFVNSGEDGQPVSAGNFPQGYYKVINIDLTGKRVFFNRGISLTQPTNGQLWVCLASRVGSPAVTGTYCFKWKDVQ